MTFIRLRCWVIFRQIEIMQLWHNNFGMARTVGQRSWSKSWPTCLISQEWIVLPETRGKVILCLFSELCNIETGKYTQLLFSIETRNCFEFSSHFIIFSGDKEKEVAVIGKTGIIQSWELTNCVKYWWRQWHSWAC